MAHALTLLANDEGQVMILSPSAWTSTRMPRAVTLRAGELGIDVSAAGGPLGTLPLSCVPALGLAKEFHLGSVRSGEISDDGEVSVRWLPVSPGDF